MKEKQGNWKKELLNLIQKDFPLTEKPFEILSKKLGVSERDIINFLKELKEKGIIRHFGATLNSRKLGYKTLLCACHMKDRETIETIAKHKTVSHAYLRRHYLNFWFTIISKAPEEVVKELEKNFNLKIYTFPAKRKFKVRAVFEI